MTTSTIEKLPDSDIPYGLVRKNPPAPAERTAEEQAAYEEGVEAAKRALHTEPIFDPAWDVERPLPEHFAGTLCEAIDAACLPEPEEEIEVTEAMRAKAVGAWGSVHGGSRPPPNGEDLDLIFTAMERQRRLEDAEREAATPGLRHFENSREKWTNE